MIYALIGFIDSVPLYKFYIFNCVIIFYFINLNLKLTDIKILIYFKD